MKGSTGSGTRALALALFVAAVLTSPMDAQRVGPIGGITDLLMLTACGIALLRFLVIGRRVPTDRYLPVVASSAALGLAGAIGTLSAITFGESVVNLGRFTATTVVMPLAVASLAPRRDEVRRLAWAYILGCVASSVVSFLTVNPVVGRSSGLASHPNVLGISAAFALAILAGLVDSATPRGRWFGTVCGLVLLGGLSRSGSRAAVLALIVSVAVYLVVTHRYRVAWYLLTIVVIAIAALATGAAHLPDDSAIGRVTQPSLSTEQSNDERAELTAIVLDRVEQNVLLGSGFGNATEAHNIFLQVVDIGGLLAIAAFAALAASILRAGWLGRHDPVAAGCMAMYVGYLVSGVVANSLWDRWLWFPIVIGLAASQGPSRDVRCGGTQLPSTGA